jgi:hypothetical protein
MDYGQMGPYFGYYYGVLATEYKLLLESNHPNEAGGISVEVGWALSQFKNYLDECEVLWYGKQNNSYDGFFIRSDIPGLESSDNFWQGDNLLKLNENSGIQSTDLWNGNAFGNFHQGHPGYANYEWDHHRTYREAMSVDEAIGHLLGLALIHKCMPGTDESSLADEIAYKIITYIRYTDYSWKFKDPNGGKPDGRDGSTMAWGFYKAAEFFGYNNMSDYFAGFPILCPQCFLPEFLPADACAAKTTWNDILQTIPCSASPDMVSNVAMYLPLAAIGDSWTTPGIWCSNTTPLAIYGNSNTPDCKWGPFYLLLYKVLHPEAGIDPGILADMTEKANKMMAWDQLCEGPFSYWQAGNAVGGWASTYRWHKNTCEQWYGSSYGTDSPTLMGNYDALDYMLLYNLYAIVMQDYYNNSPPTDYHSYGDVTLSGNWPASNGFASTLNPGKLVAPRTIGSNATVMNAMNPNNQYGQPGELLFLAGNFIFLLPGFNAEYGSNFKANIKYAIECDDFYSNTVGFGNYLDARFGSTALLHEGNSNDNDFNDKTQELKFFSENLSSQKSIDSILVYPNPTSGKVSILLNGIDPNKIIGIFVFNSTMEKIDDLKIRQDKIEYDLSNRLPGIYVLKVLTNSNTFINKIIKTE